MVHIEIMEWVAGSFLKWPGENTGMCVCVRVCVHACVRVNDN